MNEEVGPGELPWLYRIRQEVDESWQRRVGQKDALRPPRRT